MAASCECFCGDYILHRIGHAVLTFPCCTSDDNLSTFPQMGEGFSLSKKGFRQTADESQLKQDFHRERHFLVSLRLTDRK